MQADGMLPAHLEARPAALRPQRWQARQGVLQNGWTSEHGLAQHPQLVHVRAVMGLPPKESSLCYNMNWLHIVTIGQSTSQPSNPILPRPGLHYMSNLYQLY